MNFICPYCNLKLTKLICAEEYCCYSCKNCSYDSSVSKVYVDCNVIDSKDVPFKYELFSKNIIIAADIKNNKNYYRFYSDDNCYSIGNEILSLQELKEKLELLQFYT